jgi:hypothetical protein
MNYSERKLIYCVLTYLQSSCHQTQINIPQQTAETEKDDTTLDRNIGSAEEIGNRPDLVRIEDETEKLLFT